MRSSTSNRPSFQLTEKVRKEIEKIVDARVREAHITREDFSELKQIVGELARAQQELAVAQQRTEHRVAELAAAQQHTEQRVAELAAAQQRTEQRIAELTEAQKRTEQRVDRLEIVVQELIEAQKRTEQRIAELTEVQKRTEQRVDRLEIVVQELIEAQKRTEQRVEQLTIAQQRMTEEITALARRLTKVEERMGRMIGRDLEREYREKAYAYLGQVLRNIQVVSVQELEADLESRLSEAELDDLRLLDVLLRGKPRQAMAVAEIWLALEVSAVVDRIDVERAQRRAALLRKAGYGAVPAVAGEEVTHGGEQAARTECVVLLQNGRRQYWDEALARVWADGA